MEILNILRIAFKALAPQQGALGPHHARRHHRRRLGHRHDRPRLRGARRHRRADPEHGHERHLRLRRAASSRPGGVAHGGIGSVQTLTLEDAQAHPDQVPTVAPPDARRPRAAPRSWPATRTGTPRSRAATRTTWSSATGRSPRARTSPPATSSSADKVCLLGATVAKTLFPGEDPVGQVDPHQEPPLPRRRRPRRRRARASGARTRTTSSIAPYTTIQKKLLGITYIHQVMISATARRRRRADRRGGDAAPAPAAPDPEPRGRRLHGAHRRGDGPDPRRSSPRP